MLSNDLHIEATINLYYDLHLPEGKSGPLPLLIAVHGYGAHKRYMMREALQVVPDSFAVASVQAPHQHFRKTDDGYKVGFGWLTEHRPHESVELHQKFLLDLIEKLAGDGKIDPTRVYLYGFSQAVGINFRFAFTHPHTLAGVVAVCGGIPGDLETNADYNAFDAPTLYIYGDDDEFYALEKFREFESKLAERLSNLTAKQYSAKHEITDEMRADITKFFRTAAK
ncbi:MAG: acetylxylan esterase [Blastocatellia bacterium]|nr:acetylxylan esterase [Blastocatellia bacterium]